MINAQVCFGMVPIRGHSKSAVSSHSTVPLMSQCLTERAVGTLAARVFTRAAAVDRAFISLQCEFSLTSKKPRHKLPSQLHIISPA